MRSSYWLDITKWIEILVLPLVNAHVKLLPLLGESFISKLLLHFGNGEILEYLLVLAKVIVHANKLFLNLVDV